MVVTTSMQPVAMLVTRCSPSSTILSARKAVSTPDSVAAAFSKAVWM
jgi:hypothetical protein